MTHRQRPAAPPSKLIPALLAVAIVAAGFATLVIRLEVTEEGYRLSSVQTEIRNLQIENQRLKLETASLESHQRLREIAPRYGLAAPVASHVVVVP